MLLCSSLGFDVGELSEDAPDDFEGLDGSAAHIANLLSTEPADSKFLPPKTHGTFCHELYLSLLTPTASTYQLIM